MKLLNFGGMFKNPGFNLNCKVLKSCHNVFVLGDVSEDFCDKRCRKLAKILGMSDIFRK